ncbi:MAG TPA: OB-fold nucleic acid binding domain-containing protein, partial [Gemmatimonadaceae bacterium]|nr:OB-fold nucleic acid binding domain-containing protein [Gemmatimonadaceae bacterium]
MTQADVFGTLLRPSGLAGAFRAGDAGRAVTVAGWVHRVRNLGGIAFVDLRDRAGLLQVSFNPEWTAERVINDASSLGQEYVVQVSGTIALRPENMRNADMTSGDVELRAT